MSRAEITPDGSTLTVRVPLTFRKRGGRKLVIAPNGSESWAPPRQRVDNTIVKSIARAFRWRNLLETGTHTTVAEIAAAEKINASYVGRVLRLTCYRRRSSRRFWTGGSRRTRGFAEAVSVGWREQRAELLSGSS
jgi:hypothetical protein